MWECNFAEESMDYKLFWLRFVKKIWVILAAIVLGALLVGGPYYLIKVVGGEGPSYKIVSEYYLDYAEDSAGNAYTYFNYYTWSEIVNTDEFIALLKAELPSEMQASDRVLRDYTDATVESDTRYLSTTVATEHPGKTAEIARAMERAVQQFAKEQKELYGAKVVTMPPEAEKTYPDVRPARAFVLGAVLGLFVGLLYVSISLIADNSIFLPKEIEKRYHVKALGCKSFTESKNNISYCLKNKKTIGFVGLGELEKSEAEEIIDMFKSVLSKEREVSVFSESVLSEKFDFEELRKFEGIVLLVRAGAKNGKRIERAVEQMERQNVDLTGAFLMNEDEKLIKCYYR